MALDKDDIELFATVLDKTPEFYDNKFLSATNSSPKAYLDDDHLRDDMARFDESEQQDAAKARVGILARVMRGCIERYQNAKDKVERSEALQSIWLVSDAMQRTIEDSKITSIAKSTVSKLSEFGGKAWEAIKADPDNEKIYASKAGQERIGKVIGRVTGEVASLCIGCGIGLVEAAVINSAILISTSLLCTALAGPVVGPPLALGATILGGTVLSYKATEKTVAAVNKRVTPIMAAVGDNVDKAIRYGVKGVGAAGKHAAKVAQEKISRNNNPTQGK